MTIAVIGRGLIGSAAARHLAQAGHHVLLIGPDEPVDITRHQGVFASHYDEGRITRKMATDPFWAHVSAASIGRYAEIGAASGIPFFTDCGAMMAGPADGPLMRSCHEVRRDLHVDAELVDSPHLKERFSFFRFPGDYEAYYESNGAGHISPRKLVEAQTTAATKAGARIVPAPVIDLADVPNGMTVVTDEGSIPADQVLVAAGGMTDHLLPTPVGLRVLARTVVFFEVSAETADNLAGMPSLVFRFDDRSEPYLLPPILYPDGRFYIKLGGDPVDVPLRSANDIGTWFRSGGNPDVMAYLIEMFRSLMPDVDVLSTHMHPCMTTYTTSGRPIIDRIGPHLSVATGGNGAGAKCSDELGRLGAEIVLGASHQHLQNTA